jgi:hypothetical protein
MASRSYGKFLAVLMAVLLPASILSAETRGAMLFASKSAVINGKPVSATTAIFAGDKIEVPGNSAATITLAGSSVLVPANATVIFHGDSVSLEPQTAVSVVTTVGLAAEVERLKFEPANKSAKFQIARYNGHIVRAAKEGNIMVAGLAGNHVIVPEGATTTIPDPAPQKPGAIPAASGPGTVGELPAWVAALIAVGAAATAAAIAIATTGAPATPAHP